MVSRPSVEEALILQREWAPLAADCRGNGMRIFETIFAKHPNYQKLFGSYAPKDLGSLSKDLKLMCHSAFVAKVVGVAIAQLGCPSILDPVLRNLGAEHMARKVTPSMIAHVPEIVIAQLEVCNAGKITRPLWDKFFAYVHAVMAEGAKTPVEAVPGPCDQALCDLFATWDRENLGYIKATDLVDIMHAVADSLDEAKLHEVIKKAGVDEKGNVKFTTVIDILQGQRQ